MVSTRLFLSIVDTRPVACSATIALSLLPASDEDVAAAWSVSITLARISLSGRSRPRRRRGKSYVTARELQPIKRLPGLAEHTHGRHLLCVCRLRYGLDECSESDQVCILSCRVCEI